MFDSISPLLLSPDSIRSAPPTFDQNQLGVLRHEAKERALEYIRSTPPEEYGVHPLGFLNIPLFESRSHRIRIHIWYGSMFSATSPYKIHDHSYSSYSILLAGRLRNLIYAESAADAGNTEQEYQVALATPGMTSTTLQLTGDRVRLEPSAEMNLLSGSAYGLWRDVFHYAYARSDFVATLYFHLRHPDSRGLSRVAVPIQAVAGGPHGRFQYDLLDRRHVLALERAMIRALG
jgi:hypothetical protein